MANPNGHPETLVPGAGGGPQPGAGRPPNAWKARCAECASKEERFKVAEEILKDKDHPAWLGAWKFVAEQAYGKATQPFSLDDVPTEKLLEMLRGQK